MAQPDAGLIQAGEARELKVNIKRQVANFPTETNLGSFPLKDYVNNSGTDGVIILQKGEIVFEAYPRMEREDHHLYFSVTKPFVSTLIAILEERDQMDVSKSIDHYMPELKESAWEGIPVIDILDMASGINCREKEEDSYDNPNSCFMKFHAAVGFSRQNEAWDNPINFLTTMDRYEPNGQKYDYSGVNTWVLTWLLERVSGKPFVELVSEEIWKKMGAESDASILTTANGLAATSMGMRSNLRDLARFGLLFTPSGSEDPYAVIPESYLRKIQMEGRPELYAAGYSDNHFKDDTEILHNTYQWDHVTKEGDFFKSGWHGQGLYISPSLDLVIAFFGTHHKESGPNQLPRISRQLVRSGIFEH